MTNKVKEHIGLEYLMIEIRLCTLIFLELNILLKVIKIKIKINNNWITQNRIQSADSVMCGFHFILSFSYTITSPNDYQEITR